MKAIITDDLASGDQLNLLESALFRGKIGRREFIKMAVAAGVSLAAASVIAKQGEAVAINQLYNSQALKSSYDYIVIGSGKVIHRVLDLV